MSLSGTACQMTGRIRCLSERAFSTSRARCLAHDRTALRPDQVVSGDADGPSEPRRLRNHLIQRMDRFGSANLGDRFHVCATLEKLHAKRDRAQLQEGLEFHGEIANPVRYKFNTSRYFLRRCSGPPASTLQ